eukprot:166896-Pyramimonas_sp.AAC.1
MGGAPAPKPRPALQPTRSAMLFPAAAPPRPIALLQRVLVRRLKASLHQGRGVSCGRGSPALDCRAVQSRHRLPNERGLTALRLQFELE